MPIDAKEVAEKIHETLRGGKINNYEAIHVLAGLDPHTLDNVKNEYGEKYGNSLVLDISKHVTGHFGDGLVALLKDPDELDAEYLYKAMKGVGTRDHILIEILATRTPDRIKKVRDAFVKKYNDSLDKWLTDETSGSYRKYLLALARGDRIPASTPVDKEAVVEDVNRLYKAGEGRIGTNEEVFVEIFATRSWKHLRQVIEQYGKTHENSLATAIKKEFSGDLERALLWTLESVENRHGFFAKRLHDSMAGLGTKDDDLVRIMVTRRSNDLWEISEEYNKIFNKTLKEDIAGDTSGDYKQLLTQMLKEA